MRVRKELRFSSVLKMMQSQISFYPDRNFHAMKILNLMLHAPTYLCHADTNFGEKKMLQVDVNLPSNYMIGKKIGLF